MARVLRGGIQGGEGIKPWLEKPTPLRLHPSHRYRGERPAADEQCRVGRIEGDAHQVGQARAERIDREVEIRDGMLRRAVLACPSGSALLPKPIPAGPPK